MRIDASNAFNSINQTLLIHNVQILHPEIATYINNCYMIVDYRLERGLIKQRKHQEDLIAMGMYTLGLMTVLTSVISNNTRNLIHIAFPNDSTGVGKIHELIEWWRNVLNYDPYLGYYVNVSKS